MAVSSSKKQMFSKRVVDLREQRELSQAELARRVGVTQTCVWNWESGNTYPRPAAMNRLAQVLATSAGQLGGSEAHTSPNVDERAAGSSLPEIILEARQRVAVAAGVAVSNVRVLLDYGD